MSVWDFCLDCDAIKFLMLTALKKGILKHTACLFKNSVGVTPDDPHCRVFIETIHTRQNSFGKNLECCLWKFLKSLFQSKHKVNFAHLHWDTRHHHHYILKPGRLERKPFAWRETRRRRENTLWPTRNLLLCWEKHIVLLQIVVWIRFSLFCWLHFSSCSTSPCWLTSDS